MVFIAQDKKKCYWEHTTCGPLCQVSSGLRLAPLEVLVGLSLLPSSYNFTSVCVVWVCFCVYRACACVSAPSGCQSSASSLSPKSPKRAASSSSLSVNISHEYFMAVFFLAVFVSAFSQCTLLSLPVCLNGACTLCSSTRKKKKRERSFSISGV